jgi:hypothetical protein
MRLTLVIGMGVLAANLAHAADCSDGKMIEDHVCGLAPGFDPTPDPRTNGTYYASPQCDNSISVDPSDIKKAFTAAPDKLKADLCSLTKIFITTDADSWGKWENSKFPAVNGQPGHDDTFIAISTSALGKQLKDRHNDHLRMLGLQKYGAYHDDGNSKILSILNTLAHEMGHIKWRKEYGKSSCSIDTFMGYSWTNPNDAMKYATASDWRWTAFGIETSKDGTPFGMRKNTIPAPSKVRTPKALADIYRNGVWTALGASNPEEDFVVTYAMAATMLAKPVNPNFKLRIRISGKYIRVNDPNFRPTNGKPNYDLMNKYNCVSSLL